MAAAFFMSDECPACGGKWLRERRFGLWMTKAKVRILDAIMRDDDGVAIDDLADALGITRGCLKVQVCQINILLDGTGWKIVCYNIQGGSRSRALGAWNVYQLVANNAVDKGLGARVHSQA
jgi:hypothetical protein